MSGRHVFLLGAGFSRAVSGAMPLTDELGRRALDLMDAHGHAPAGNRLSVSPSLNFESWLSLLSEDQPQLSDAENRDNAAVLAHERDAIAAVLFEGERKALARPAPAWLYEL